MTDSAEEAVHQEDFPTAYAEAFCRRVQPCCDRYDLAYDREACTDATEKRVRRALGDALEMGGTYDAASARSCVTLVGDYAASCEPSPTAGERMREACMAAVGLSGETAPDPSCEPGTSCAEGIAARPESCAGTDEGGDVVAPPETCVEGTVTACRCADGSDGSVSCVDGALGACVCTPDPGAGGAAGAAGSSGGGGAPNACVSCLQGSAGCPPFLGGGGWTGEVPTGACADCSAMNCCDDGMLCGSGDCLELRTCQEASCFTECPGAGATGNAGGAPMIHGAGGTFACGGPRVIPNLVIGADDCSYAIPVTDGMAADPTMLNVLYDGVILLPYVGSEDGCTPSGWFYDDPAAPSMFTLCPNDCAVMIAEAGGIEVALGCATVEE